MMKNPVTRAAAASSADPTVPAPTGTPSFDEAYIHAATRSTQPGSRRGIIIIGQVWHRGVVGSRRGIMVVSQAWHREVAVDPP